MAEDAFQCGNATRLTVVYRESYGGLPDEHHAHTLVLLIPTLGLSYLDTRIPVGDPVWGSLVECPMKHK